MSQCSALIGKGEGRKSGRKREERPPYIGGLLFERKREREREQARKMTTPSARVPVDSDVSNYEINRFFSHGRRTGNVEGSRESGGDGGGAS